jgi:DNA-binding NarL/FixJ family response regulator
LLTNKFQKLFTRREKEILHLLVYGKTSEEIASYFNIEKSTVDKHRQNLLFKANVENTMQLLAFCIDNELISLPLS